MARAYYLRVRNWDRYQHYKTRKDGWRPSWIKLYLVLTEDPDFVTMSNDAKWLFIGLLIKAAKTNNLIPSKVQWLSMRLGMTDQEFTKALPELVKNGFVERFEVKANSRETLEESLEQNRREENRVEEKENKNPLFKIPNLKDVA